MLQEVIVPAPGENSVVLETERLTLRQPTLADAEAIVSVVADKRVAINLRRVPHPYAIDDAIAFVTGTSEPTTGDKVFLVECEGVPIGLVGISWEEDEATPELGYCFGVASWGKGFATEAARAVIDYAFDEFAVDALRSSARVLNPASRHVLEKCGFNWTGVELHRFQALGSSTPVDCLQAGAKRVVVAEKLEPFDASILTLPTKAGSGAPAPLPANSRQATDKR